MSCTTTMGDIFTQLIRMKSTMATQNDIEELKEEDEEKEKRISKRSNELRSLQNTIHALKRTHLDTEQQARRKCLRIYNVDFTNNEENCLSKLQNILRNVQLEIPQQVIDGVHKGSHDNNDETSPPLIVKFSTWKHRTKLYKARKLIRERLGYSLQVDLTKENLDVLRAVRIMGEVNRLNTGFEYAYAGMNCLLYMKVNGKFVCFKTLEDAKMMLGLKNDEKRLKYTTKKKFSKVAKRFSRGQNGSNRNHLTHSSNSTFSLLNEEDDDIDFDDIREIPEEHDDIDAISEESDDQDKTHRPPTLRQQRKHSGTGRQLPQIGDTVTGRHTASGETGRQLPQLPPGESHLGNTEPIVFYDEDNEFEYKKE